MVVGDHPSTVAFYDYHREARRAGSIAFYRPSKIVKSGPHYRSLAENDRWSLDNRLLTTTSRQFLKILPYPPLDLGKLLGWSFPAGSRLGRTNLRARRDHLHCTWLTIGRSSSADTAQCSVHKLLRILLRCPHGDKGVRVEP